MEAKENTRGATSLDILIRFWEDRLGKDGPLNPPNPLGEVIQDTIYHLKEGRLAGIKEVVEWLGGKRTGAERYPSMSSPLRTTYAISEGERQAKLKEWGVE